VEQLSKIVDVDVVEDEFGAINVTVGGYTLVSRTYLAELKFTDDDINPASAKLEWRDPISGNVLGPARIKSGMLKGFIDMRDEVIGGNNGYIRKIGELAAGIANEVNAQHRLGRDLNGDLGEDFFVTKDPLNPVFSAGNIAVNQNIINNTNKIAASKNNIPDPVIRGDNTNALKIAQLKNKQVMNGGVATFDDFYRSTVGRLGVQAQEAERMAHNQSLLVDQLINKREGISGVSLDEEMTNMIKYQHAYTAAARVINTMDEMLELIVNRLGMAGR
jgi:flagellar hook-associated protein 1 FlgK